MMSSDHFKLLLLLFCIAFALLELSPADAACVTPGTPGNDILVCTGTITVGIDGAGGDDFITVKAGASVLIGGASPRGIVVADGANSIENLGTVSATTSGNWDYSDTAVGALFGLVDASANSSATVATNACGIVSGNGINRINNYGVISATAASSATSVASSNAALGSADATATATTEAEVVGIVLGNGNNLMRNFESGNISASATANVSGSGAKAVSVAVGSGDATATSSATARATGIVAGTGDNVLENRGTLTVSSATEAYSYAGTDLYSAILPTAHATVFKTSTASATGLSMGDGNNTISNSGTISVDAHAYGLFYSVAVSDAFSVSAAYVPVLFVPLIANAYANATTTALAPASGIVVGNGDNHVVNQGSILVTATSVAEASATAVVGSIPFFWEADASATAHAAAIGIDAGHGGNEIINYGSITVAANAGTNAIAVAPIWHSYDDSAAWAFGIRTGNGDDTISNYGSIETKINNVDGLGVGISSGGGNDQVILYDGSSISGSIDLGTGGDRCTLVGHAVVTGPVDAGAGSDQVVLNGAGSFSSSLINFETALKLGAGTFTLLAGLPSMQTLTVRDGSLALGSPYTFMAGGNYQATIAAGDGQSRLQVTEATTLAGSVEVLKNRGFYRDGSRHPIVVASGGISGVFDTVLLPTATQLLSFSLEQQPTALDVVASAPSFTTVAKNRVERAVARYLDAISPSASGDVAEVLAEFQGLPASEYSTAFHSLSADTYDNFNRASNNSTMQYLRTLNSRMQGIRANGMTSGSNLRSDIQLDKTLLLAYNGSDASIAELYDVGKRAQTSQKFGGWIDGFGNWGDQDGDSDGYTGFNYHVAGGAIGLDYLLCDRLIVGVSGGYSYTDIDLDDDKGAGNIKSTFGSLYGSYFTKQMYVETALTYSRQDFSNDRTIVVGALQSQARSNHNGDAYSIFLGGGYNFAMESWLLQPLASLRYIYLTEDDFRESGAGGVNLIVGNRSTESLESELGLRLARVMPTGIGTFIPEVRAAWNYDFGLDDRVITAAFEGSPNIPFAIAGQDVKHHGATVGAGVTLVQKNGFSTSLKYDAELREDYSSHGLFGEIRYSF